MKEVCFKAFFSYWELVSLLNYKLKITIPLTPSLVLGEFSRRCALRNDRKFFLSLKQNSHDKH